MFPLSATNFEKPPTPIEKKGNESGKAADSRLHEVKKHRLERNGVSMIGESLKMKNDSQTIDTDAFEVES